MRVLEGVEDAKYRGKMTDGQLKGWETMLRVSVPRLQETNDDTL